MSVKRLNYTGRKRIPRERVSVGIAGDPPLATVEAHFDLSGLGFPTTARVVLEAQASWTVQSFDFGTVEQYASPKDARLTEFSSMAGVLFRLKIIGTGDAAGRLLGVADGVKPNGDAESAAQKSFVVVRPEDLGERLWKVDFDEAQPLLLVNSRLGDHQDFVRRSEVAALVLPEVLERILVKAAANGEDEDGSGPGWIATALRLGARLAGRQPPPATDDEALEVWADEAVSAFARRHHFADLFLDAAEQSS